MRNAKLTDRLQCPQDRSTEGYLWNLTEENKNRLRTENIFSADDLPEPTQAMRVKKSQENCQLHLLYESLCSKEIGPDLWNS